MPLSPISPQEPRWNPLVVSLVGTVCSMFLFFSFYKILRRHCCSFCGITFSRNPGQRQLLNAANTDDPSQQSYSRGLESSVMHSLPITQFRKNDEEMSRSDAECAVCLGEFEDGEWLKHLPNCTHIFHVACIDTWFQTHSNCPLCRSHVHDLSDLDHEYSVSMYSLLETLRREDFFQDRAAHYQILRSEILQNSILRYGAAHAS